MRRIVQEVSDDLQVVAAHDDVPVQSGYRFDLLTENEARQSKVGRFQLESTAISQHELGFGQDRNEIRVREPVAQHQFVVEEVQQAVLFEPHSAVWTCKE